MSSSKLASSRPRILAMLEAMPQRKGSKTNPIDVDDMLMHVESPTTPKTKKEEEEPINLTNDSDTGDNTVVPTSRGTRSKNGTRTWSKSPGTNIEQDMEADYGEGSIPRTNNLSSLIQNTPLTPSKRKRSLTPVKPKNRLLQKRLRTVSPTRRLALDSDDESMGVNSDTLESFNPILHNMAQDFEGTPSPRQGTFERLRRKSPTLELTQDLIPKPPLSATDSDMHYAEKLSAEKEEKSLGVCEERTSSTQYVTEDGFITPTRPEGPDPIIYIPTDARSPALDELEPVTSHESSNLFDIEQKEDFFSCQSDQRTRDVISNDLKHETDCKLEVDEHVLSQDKNSGHESDTRTEVNAASDREDSPPISPTRRRRIIIQSTPSLGEDSLAGDTTRPISRIHKRRDPLPREGSLNGYPARKISPISSNLFDEDFEVESTADGDVVDDDDALEEFINDGEVDFETGSEGTMDVDDTTSQANSDINGGDDDNDDDEEDDDTSSATASDVSEESQNLVPAEYDINLQRSEEEFFELYVMYMLHYAHEPHILEKVQVQDRRLFEAAIAKIDNGLNAEPVIYQQWKAPFTATLKERPNKVRFQDPGAAEDGFECGACWQRGKHNCYIGRGTSYRVLCGESGTYNRQTLRDKAEKYETYEKKVYWPNNALAPNVPHPPEYDKVIVGYNCARRAETFHQLHHFKYHLYRWAIAELVAAADSVEDADPEEVFTSLMDSGAIEKKWNEYNRLVEEKKRLTTLPRMLTDYIDD
ncbi:hypothetical protein DL96DRAFT_473712 [Flagelloscypha sp. PMI_526]|nr:hypothetical protein DL96DRAFT_473712 [Flagelloscypha sp. PMI_526]